VIDHELLNELRAAAGTTGTLSTHQLIWADLPGVRRHRSRNAPWSSPGPNKRAPAPQAAQGLGVGLVSVVLGLARQLLYPVRNWRNVSPSRAAASFFKLTDSVSARRSARARSAPGTLEREARRERPLRAKARGLRTREARPAARPPSLRRRGEGDARSHRSGSHSSPRCPEPVLGKACASRRREPRDRPAVLGGESRGSDRRGHTSSRVPAARERDLHHVEAV